MNIISKIKGCLALAVVAAGFAAWAAAVAVADVNSSLSSPSL